MKDSNFFAELKRRNIYKVAVTWSGCIEPESAR
jgi:hypothetical protein